MTSQIPTRFDINTTYRMNSGHNIPALGYGVYQTPAAKCEEVTLHAFKAGYRHVDSARAYRNEQPCADAIRASGLKREDVFFTSKVPPKNISYEGAKSSIESTFFQTKLDYIDLYLLHAPYGGKEGRLGAWKALAEAQKAGKIRSIGVSNYGVHHLAELEEYIKTSDVGGTIDVNQCEVHPWLPRDDIVNWCKERGVVVEAYCPIVRGERAEEPVLKELAKKHNKTWAQVLIRWSLQKGYVPLPKSETPSRIEANADVYDFKLDDDDMKKLNFPDSYAPCAWDPTTSRE
jgi:diketogulonate reductase-like aldo/keto reductase